jgi:peroxiredoxin
MSMRRVEQAALAAWLLLGLAACQRESAPVAATPPPGVQLGTYRVALKVPAGEVPFGLELAREAGQPVAYLLNGPEKMRVAEVVIDGAHLTIKMPGYQNVLSADATGNTLAGELVLSKPNAKDQHIPLTAELGQTWRFFATPSSDNADVAGRWAATFVDDSGEKEVAVGEFTQAHDAVTGTFLADTGDHRYLQGQVQGDTLYLSTFDGAHVFLYKAKIGADGTLLGDFWSGMLGHEKLVGRRDAKATLSDASKLTAMKKGSRQLEFAFPDLDGKQVSSSDARFKGKVLVVALAGSWCPNCHDEAAFLEPLYAEYKPRGLEVVSLQFEHFGDFERAVAATQRFRQHYGIEYTTLIAGISDKDDASKRLPSLEQVTAFPTTIFVDRKGNVRTIHTGFTGPATGEHYTEFVTQTRALLDKMLAEG